uniref:Reverse transcriptase domain-containing protein n=1 Tax=Neogobius melanostomus TaxID=47308 RepID=A0A8C6TJ76_9GOBI
MRKAKANFYVSVIESANGNGKKVWETINKITGRGTNKDSEVVLQIESQLVKDPATVAMEFNNFFKDSVSEISQLFILHENVTYPVNESSPIFTMAEINETEVASIIKGLKNSKAKDVYGIDANFIKAHKDILVCPITRMINMSIRHSIVPTAWKVATITPIFKSGNKNNVNNYRPISILPIISKILEKWVAKQLTTHLDKGHTPLHPMQFGFRAKYSTESAINLFLEKVKHDLDYCPVVGAVFLDLKRAFDTVDHQILLSRLTKFNFSEQAVSWMKSYLSTRTHCVTVSGIKSTFLNCEVGVPQGSILGPILFSLYINDLPNICPHFHTQLYADDAVIFTNAKSNSEVSEKLTSAMCCIDEWLSKSCLLLNSKKTVCMFFSKRPTARTSSNVFIKGEELQIVDKFKYLGVILDSTLSFKNHVKHMCKIVNFNLRNFRQIRTSLPENAAKMFLHCMIFSHIEYCITNWSLTSL